MKKIKFLALLLLVAAFGFTSCQTEPIDPALLDNNPVIPAGPASFKVDFGNQTFNATSTQAVIDGELMAIGGIRGTNGETVGIVITGSGEQSFTGEDVLFSYDPSESSEFTYNNYTLAGVANGTVNITEIDEVNHTISGTFSFTGYYSDFEANLPPVVFSNGQFTDIPYTGSVVIPGDDEYFRAKVDGVLEEYGLFGSAEVSGALSITGSDFNEGINHNIFIGTQTQPGTYVISNSLSNPPFVTYTLDDVDYTSTTGTLTIISNDGTFIKGTFNYTAVNGNDTITVTAGEFNIEY
ncbi:MAG: DUF6252 family protein [Bacteroidota bacterium]